MVFPLHIDSGFSAKALQLDRQDAEPISEITGGEGNLNHGLGMLLKGKARPLVLRLGAGRRLCPPVQCARAVLAR